MSSPGNGYPQRGAPGMFSTPMNSPMFSRAQSSPRFLPTPQGRYSPSYSSQHTYSPVNASQGGYSPTNSSQYLYSSVNLSQDGYSPRNQFKGGYSSRNSSQNSSFGGYTSTRSASPLHQQALRQSFNKSKDSSVNSSRSSLDSTDYNRRYKPYGVNKRNNQSRNSWNSNKSYNIEDYILPSMLEDPWAGLKVDRKKKPEE
ncbi:unnamed protein product [Larinioides sclopetarius]|uniref:M-phase-specific PLK1-interacting protein n=1 Tax=Larinioides sclopetarius TaxID=280406 RepID=A0AAV1YTL6_9ARAC